MGNRTSPRRPIIPYWSTNVSLMLAEPEARVWVECSCGFCRELTKDVLARIVRERRRGPLYSLWGRQPKCPSCAKLARYCGHHAPGARVIRFYDDDAAEDVARLHEAWRVDRARV